MAETSPSARPADRSHPVAEKEVERHPAISLWDVSHQYQLGRKTVRAIANITLEVFDGETVCIVGPSGCGKSTLLKILVGLLDPTNGRVVPAEQIRTRGIGFVQQRPALLPWRTVMENAILGIEVKRQITADTLDGIRDELFEFGLRGFEDAPIEALSGGMMQKVALIAALFGNPALLACDEPFSAVDFVSRLSLLNIFKNKCYLNDITTVFVTHNIEEAIFLGHRVIVLSGRPGQVVDIVPIDQLEHDDDIVKCRQTPEFMALFQRIWTSLDATV